MRRGDASGTAAYVMLTSITDYSIRLDALAPAVIADEPDAVHQARVLVRRLRSVLAAGRGIFESVEVASARRELGRLGDDLGRARDLEVRVAQAEAHLGAHATDAMRRHLVDEVRARHRAAHASLVARIESGAPMSAPIAPVLRGRGRTLEPGAPGAADAGLTGLLAREVHRVLRADARAGRDLDSLHRLRRKARRLRYVADAVADGVDHARREAVLALSAAAEAVQDLLGANRDGRLFAHELARLVRHGGDDAASIAGYRVIAASVETEAAERLRDLPDVMHELRRCAAEAVGPADR